MDAPAIIPKRVGPAEDPFRFSVCTLVTRREQYEAMLESFRRAGFTPDRCEFLYVDNTEGNQHDAYQAFNLFLRRAQGRYVILCHQDVELRFDGIAELEQRIEELDRLDPAWGLLGNAGGVDLEQRAVWISDGEGCRFYSEGTRFPRRVQTLDENFILVRGDANLATSADLEGFHLYGTDLCQIARTLGYGAYVVAFHLFHRSAGKVDESYERCRRRLVRKYRRALAPRYLQTTMLTRLYLSGSAVGGALLGSRPGIRIARLLTRLRSLVRSRSGNTEP